MKGQSSMEFLTYVSLSMFMLAVLYGVMADKQKNTFQQQAQNQLNEIADKVSFNLEMAIVQGQGYSRIISFPQNIAGQEYEVSTINGSILVNNSENTIVESSRYNGRDISFTSDGSNVYRVKHNESGVFMVEQ